MKKLLFIFFISLSFLTSCVEAPVEDEDNTPDVVSLTADFDDETFESVTTVVVIDDVSMSLKATEEDGSYFRIKLPESPIVGTYDLEA